MGDSNSLSRGVCIHEIRSANILPCLSSSLIVHKKLLVSMMRNGVYYAVTALLPEGEWSVGGENASSDLNQFMRR
jgi:hypothetical protein